MKTAWVFPGQGSQSLGMGADLLDLAFAKVRLKQAQAILGWDACEICLNQESKLSQTLYTQPCLYVVSTILADLIKDAGFTPSLVAGHSLGEYAALYAAEVFSFETGLQLVKRRAELMTSAPHGIMVALIGFNRDRLEEKISQASNVVIANDNHNGQIVISGTTEGVNAVLDKVKVRRIVPLKVSGAFHSPLMTEVSQEFNQILQGVTFQPAKFPVKSNVEPLAAIEATILKERLMKQMTSRVRWREIVDRLAQKNLDRVIEIGPGKVLTNTILRMYPDMKLENIGSNLELAMFQNVDTLKAIA
ncbi:MAG TPA: ACP S-malonyltransferase [Coleofasciculaceae cyanobacterium]|jgi:[acyl-carrier-protein] S-malonyltransferase